MISVIFVRRKGKMKRIKELEQIQLVKLRDNGFILY